MCCLAGVFAYLQHDGPPFERPELLRMRESMRARGPDGAGIWVSEDLCVGLAHRRLSIIDLSEAGAQPMLDSSTGNRIVFNGEIYNYQALRAELETAGCFFRSHSDTEVLLKLYAAHGQGMLARLRGMYAFAIWDEKRRGIFLVRDPFGIKPLYIADDGRTLRFASQVKALLTCGQVDTTPDPAGHVGFYLWGHVPEPYTLYRGIRALPAGTSLWIDSTGRRVHHAFFDLAEELSRTYLESEPLSAEQAQEQLRSALLDSVGLHLVADVPVGVFLSAGLDSTTVAALARQAGVAELRTVTLGFEEYAGTENDEVPLAETVAHAYGARHRTIWVCKDDLAAQFDHLLESMDQLSIDGLNSYFVSKAAHDAGLKVVLSGLGGDELFGGYSDFRQIPLLVRLLGPVPVTGLLGAGFRYVSGPLLKRFTSPKYAGLLEYGSDYAGAYLLRRGLFMPWELPDVLDGDLVREGWRELQTLPALRQTIGSVRNERLKVSALETAWYMRNQLLRDTDWASMAHSLKVRVPLVDIRLFRTVTRLVHAGHAPTKQDMAASPATPLPASVLKRRKSGFSVPMPEWLSESVHLKKGEKVERGLRTWALWLMDNRRDSVYQQ